ncbi:hypothetical protein LTR15_008929 [Elasticomyces elasticus]|nr:hypothetical protein LTR15_008929 [Elasticomyces elasticus]
MRKSSRQPSTRFKIHKMHNFTTPDSEQRAQLMLWAKAPDLETLIQLNTKYIKGGLRIHPAHSHDIDPETNDISSSLLQMNQNGLLTFQGQPQDNGSGPKPPNTVLKCDLGVTANNPEACLFCGRSCSGHYVQWTERRKLAYVQFTLSIDHRRGSTTATVKDLAARLLQDERIHALISWPRDIALPSTMSYVNANISTARYIPPHYLDVYQYIKSAHGTSCAYEIREAGSQSDLSHAKWEQESGVWSEVNDYHLLEPRMSTWFFPSDATKPFVFGVNAIDHDIELDVQLLILEAAKASILAGSLPTVVQVPWTNEEYQRYQFRGWCVGGFLLMCCLWRIWIWLLRRLRQFLGWLLA